MNQVANVPFPKFGRGLETALSAVEGDEEEPFDKEVRDGIIAEINQLEEDGGDPPDA